MLSLSAQGLSSSAIQLSWNLPEQDCFNLTSLTASCKAAVEGNRADAQSTAKAVSSLATSTTISDLRAGTSYNCSVTSYSRESELGKLIVQVQTYAPRLAITLSESEEIKQYCNVGREIIFSAFMFSSSFG